MKQWLAVWNLMVYAMQHGYTQMYGDNVYKWKQRFPHLVGARLTAYGD